MQKFLYLLIVLSIIPALLPAKTHPGNAWLWDAVVLLHNDNHCNLLAKGSSTDEICGWLKDLPVSSVQVSAYGAMGNRVTYPSAAVPELNCPDLGDWDTLAVWREAVLKSGKRFHVYMNTRGFKIYEKHPQWMQQDAAGVGRGRGPGLFDSCPRPAPDGIGYLENVLLPLVTEVAAKYRPGALWVDGDHARTPTCYCKNCTAAWKGLTGEEHPPLKPDAPGWPRWLKLEQDRYDAYRIMMAEAAHKANPDIMYASNHSWHKLMGEHRSKHDPRSAPPEIDYYTADLSHGQSLRQTRVYAMLLSAEEETPYEIMHSVFSPEVSLTRIMQQGSVTFASGGAWNLWISGSTITTPAARERAMFCAKFADMRKAALGRTFSLNQTAVLVSENSWLAERTGVRSGVFNSAAVKHAALALQDSGYGVDIINEQILQKRLSSYHALVVSGQRELSELTIKIIREFTEQGGRLIESGSPQLSALNGNGVVHAELSNLSYPDSQGIMVNCMKGAHLEPEVRQKGEGIKPHLIYAFRKKGKQTILHVTDITSFIDGKRVLPDRAEVIDPAFRIYKKGTLEIATSVAPKSVTAANAEILSYHWVSRVKNLVTAHPGGLDANLPATTVEHSWAKGILTITINNFCVHTALIIDNGAAVPSPLPLGTPLEDHFAYAHYKELNTLESDFEREEL